MINNLSLSLRKFPLFLSQDEIICLEVNEEIPIIRITEKAQKQIESLLEKQQESSLTEEELIELENYAQLDDYLSLVNRLTRNFYLSQFTQDAKNQ